MAGFLLFHGAGSDRDQSTLVAVEAAVAAAHPKVVTGRVNFPYRDRPGRRPPDRAPVLLQSVRDAASAVPRGPVVLGGRSMGGRICSMAVGDEVDPLAASGLVLISYPLHPPGRPDKLRVEHFPRIAVPCLFVHGTRDAFGTPDELTEWTATIPGPVEHVWIERGTHELRGADAQVAAAVVRWSKANRVFTAAQAKRGARPPG